MNASKPRNSGAYSFESQSSPFILRLERSVQYGIAKRLKAIALLCVLLMCAIALSACSTSTTSEGTQREEGKFPNIPKMMDQMRYWGEEKFADKMLLSDEYGTGVGTVASDLAQLVDSDGCEAILLNDYSNQKDSRVLCISFSSPAHEAEPVRRGDASLKSTLMSLPHFDYGYQDALKLLSNCGISKSSIKVYDDIYSKGLNVSTLASQQGSARWGSMYQIAGEGVTESDEPLYFSVTVCSSISPDESVFYPMDTVTLMFSTTTPFVLSPEFNKQSDSSISDDEAFGLLAEY